MESLIPGCGSVDGFGCCGVQSRSWLVLPAKLSSAYRPDQLHRYPGQSRAPQACHHVAPLREWRSVQLCSM